MTLNVVPNATCTFCGCVCDDIELHAEGDRIVKAKNACSLGESWFRHHTAERIYPDALIDGGRLDSAMTEDLQSRRIGINGVPFFVFNGRFGLSGAQEPEALLNMLDLAREEDTQKGVA